MAHIPVLADQWLEVLKGYSCRTVFDGTVGAGGHAAKMLAAHPEVGLYIACDCDEASLALAEQRLFPWRQRVLFIRGNYADLERHLEEAWVSCIDVFFWI